MTTGSWEPAAPSLPDKALLLKASKYTEPEQFSSEPVAELLPLKGQMQMSRSHWQSTLESLETDDPENPVPFFHTGRSKLVRLVWRRSQSGYLDL